MMDYYREKLPRLKQPKHADEWHKRTKGIRKDLLKKVFLAGHKKEVEHASPVVQWRGVIETDKGYRIRKLRYEGYPGMWIPALLYEPTDLKGKVPAVLNPNGHHRGGKAMDYKQARCINLAKRGMLALNTEFVGMGELQGSANHMQQGHLDLCGVAGVGVMYLAMKRGLDVLLSHKHADPDRVAMTGLSGGGWQTAVLSAIDERIGVVVPVSGHSPIWHRATKRWKDHGDLEQTPVDLCTVADYDTLTAMFAPRPSLLMHSCDDGIFRPEFMRPAIYQPAKKVYKMLGVEDEIGFYANSDPGTHNYDRDIREQLYNLLNRAWGLDTPEEDIPCEDEMLSEWDLTVGLPPNNPTYLSIAQDLANKLPKKRAAAESLTADRKRLVSILRLPSTYKVNPTTARKSKVAAGIRVRQHILEMKRWRVPVTEFQKGRSGAPVLVIGDGGRARLSTTVRRLLNQGKRVFVADLLGFGEQVIADGEYHHLFMECIAAGGDRPLGICTAQLLSLLKWVRSHGKAKKVDVVAQGMSTGMIALCAAALEPQGLGAIGVSLPDSLRRLMDWGVEYGENPVMFCFGLLREFDIEDLVTLSNPVVIAMDGRGPMR
jgi:dienelactone hydrolase